MIYPRNKIFDVLRRGGLTSELYSLPDLQREEVYSWVWPYCHDRLRCGKDMPKLIHKIGRRKSNNIVRRCPECGSGLKWREILHTKDRARLEIKKCQHRWVRTEPENESDRIIYCYDCKVTKSNWIKGWLHYAPWKDHNLEINFVGD